MNKILNIAHRGASGQYPENTMLAFEKAMAWQADGIELDVFLTQDEKIVVCHDRDLTRLAGESRDVMRSSFAELQKFDVGGGQRIPALADVFDLCGDFFSVINVEIKSTGFFTNGIEKHLVTLIREFGLASKIVVSSFNPLHLWRVKKLMPELALGYLICPEENRLVRAPWLIDRVAPRTLNLDCKMWKQPQYQHYRNRPEQKWVWTVNDVDQLRFWLTQDIAAIITNHSDVLHRLLNENHDD